MLDFDEFEDLRYVAGITFPKWITRSEALKLLKSFPLNGFASKVI